MIQHVLYCGEKVLLLSWEEARAGKGCNQPHLEGGIITHHFTFTLFLLSLSNSDRIITSPFPVYWRQGKPIHSQPQIILQKEASEVSIKLHDF